MDDAICRRRKIIVIITNGQPNMAFLQSARVIKAITDHQYICFFIFLQVFNIGEFVMGRLFKQ